MHYGMAGSLNSHADPVCICACYADRLIAMQPKSGLEAHCGTNDPFHPTYNDCNCTVGGGVREPAESDSIRYVGAMAVQCPYFYYPTPQQDYGWQTPCGRWYSYFSRCPLCVCSSITTSSRMPMQVKRLWCAHVDRSQQQLAATETV